MRKIKKHKTCIRQFWKLVFGWFAQIRIVSYDCAKEKKRQFITRKMVNVAKVNASQICLSVRQSCFFFWFITTFKIIVLPNFNPFFIRLQINSINNFNLWTVSMKWIHEKRKTEKSIFYMYVLTVFIWVHQSRKHVWTWDYIDWNIS